MHCNLKRFLMKLRRHDRAVTPVIVLESLLHTLGPSGTLLLPLFNFGFAEGQPFDIRNTPSQMGSLTEAGRLYPGAVRTGHPIYSFCAIGAKKAALEEIDNFSGYGPDLPFAMLHRDGGKIAVIDLPDQHSMTFYHYVEECKKVPYRYHKRFIGAYTDAAGVTTERSYSLFVRDLDRGVITHVEPMSRILWSRQLYQGFLPGVGSGLRVINAPDLYDAVAEIIDAGKALGTLYRIEKEI